MTLHIRPLTPDLMGDLGTLFAADPVARGCWCLHWRLPVRERAALPAGERRVRFETLVADHPPGLIAHDDQGPAAWVQITPRADVPRFQTATSARPAADTPPGTWALSCFFIRRDLRRQGVMTQLARAACAHASSHGAAAVEAAARRPGGSFAWGEGFTGLVPSLARAGFVEVENRTTLRVLMRWTALPEK
ncbi:MAG: GNAT family N-acetyltransferase [Paracoccaceae bacterium]|nr:MAG: GNAT family N-acetyltransferase [Paracoccaceae bacterium]